MKTPNKRFNPAQARTLPLLLTALLPAAIAWAKPPAQSAPVTKPTPTAAVKPAAAPITPAALPPLHIVAPPPMWSVAYSPDGKLLLVGTYRRVLAFDAATGAKTGDYVVSSDAIRALAFAPDGHTLAAATGVADKSGTILLLDAATGRVTGSVRGHYDTIDALAWEQNNLLSAGNDETVNLNDAQTGKSVATLTEHIGRCLAVAVPTKTDAANGGDIFATGGADKAVKIWDAKLRRVVVNFDQSPGPVWCLAATPRPGEFIAGCDDGRLRIFQVRADGNRRAGAPADEPDPRTGYLVREQNAHTGAVYAVAVAPDFSHTVSGGADGKVVIWNGDIGQRQHDLTDAKRDIWGLAIAPDSKRVAAASLDGQTRVYDLGTGALIFTLDAKGVVPLAMPAAPANAAGKAAR